MHALEKLYQEYLCDPFNICTCFPQFVYKIRARVLSLDKQIRKVADLPYIFIITLSHWFWDYCKSLA